MFDILPSSVYPETITLSPELEEARKNAKKEFKALPNSPERSSVLSALGRIGKPTLKRKIRDRAKRITEIVGDRFPELEKVVDQAVDCRNYYVHGSKTKIDYGKHSELLSFLTNTLEFVFAASDLIEAGWDIKGWIEQISALSHPFAQYRSNYAEELNELNKLVVD